MMKLNFTDGREIHVDEEKLLAEIEAGEAAYGRDLLEYDPYVNPGDDVTTDDVAAALRIARIRAVKPADLLRAIKRKKEIADALALIESRTDLLTMSEAEAGDVIPGPLHSLFTSLVDLRGVDVAVASNILHLKRPALVPILDRYVFTFYSYLYHTGKRPARNVATAVRLLREFRTDGRQNLNVLNALGVRMTEAANRQLPAGQKITLPPVRVLDRLIWRHVKKRTG